MGQVVGYMTTAEISRQTELVRSTAETLAWSVARRANSTSLRMAAEPFVREMPETRRAEVGAVVRAGKDVMAVPATGAIAGIPGWSKPGFAGLMKLDQRYYFGAHLAAGQAADQTDVFLYQHAPDDFFKNLLPDIATIQLLDVEVRTQIGRIDIQRTDRPRSALRSRIGPEVWSGTTTPP